MVYRILNNLAPECLSDLFYVYKPYRKNLRSENDDTIIRLILDITLKKLFLMTCV